MISWTGTLRWRIHLDRKDFGVSRESGGQVTGAMRLTGYGWKSAAYLEAIPKRSECSLETKRCDGFVVLFGHDIDSLLGGVASGKATIASANATIPSMPEAAMPWPASAGFHVQ